MRRTHCRLATTVFVTALCSCSSPSVAVSEDASVDGGGDTTSAVDGSSSDSDAAPTDSGVDAPLDTGPLCGAPGLACCGEGADAGSGCNEYLTCAATDGGASTCRGCLGGLASKFEYSCARRSDGTAWCWGYVWSPGALFANPAQIGDFAMVSEVAAGENHGCLVNDGKVHCWGSNNYGEIGTGASDGSYSWLSPTLVALPASATKVTAGGSFNCALLTDGTVSCWGLNGVGQLGNGTKVWPALPSKVSGLPAKVLDVEAGGSGACAYLEDASVWCWGDNLPGIKQTPTSTKVGTVANVVRMVIKDTVYLVTAAGAVMELSAESTFSPITELGADVVQLAMGAYHTCALRRDGSIGCKGNNSSGQLADGSITNSTKVVEAWKLGKDNVEIMCGRYLTCARDRWGAVTCFGSRSGSDGSGRLKIACP